MSGAQGERKDGWEVVRLGYRPAYDGLRALALFAVMLTHGGTRLTGGFVALDYFFVLSGFLITSLMLEEWWANGSISLAAFYGRRARRILPALFTAVALSGVLYMSLANVSRGFGWPWGAAALAVVFYVGNWAVAFAGGPHNPLGSLDHTWSLAVEEQFYIIWPLVLVFFLRRRLTPLRLSALLVCFAAASAAWRASLFFVHVGPSRYSTYYRSDTRADGLALGCALALAAASPAGRRLLQRIFGHVSLGLVAASCLVVVCFTTSEWNRRLYLGGWVGINIAAAVLIAHVMVADRSVLTRALRVRPLVYIGRRSYGCYLYHLPIFAALSAANLPIGFYPRLAARIGVSLLVAIASYRWIESPFLRGKRYPAPQQSKEPVDEPVATTPVPVPAIVVTRD